MQLDSLILSPNFKARMKITFRLEEFFICWDTTCYLVGGRTKRKLFLFKAIALSEVKLEKRRATITRYQNRWTSTEGDHLPQFCTGDAHFRAYVKSFKLEGIESCKYCGDMVTLGHARNVRILVLSENTNSSARILIRWVIKMKKLSGGVWLILGSILLEGVVTRPNLLLWSGTENGFSQRKNFWREVWRLVWKFWRLWKDFRQKIDVQNENFLSPAPICCWWWYLRVIYHSFSFIERIIHNIIYYQRYSPFEKISENVFQLSCYGISTSNISWISCRLRTMSSYRFVLLASSSATGSNATTLLITSFFSIHVLWMDVGTFLGLSPIRKSRFFDTLASFCA